MSRASGPWLAAALLAAALPAAAPGQVAPPAEQPPAPPAAAPAAPAAPPITAAPVAAVPPPAAPPGPTPEQPPGEPPRFIVLGLRAGVAFPGGAAFRDDGGHRVALADEVGTTVPLQLEVGFRTSPHLVLGGQLQLGLGRAATGKAWFCGGSGLQADSCGTSWSLRLGPQLLVDLAPDATLAPWLGGGIDLEMAGYASRRGGSTTTVSYAGLGLDVQAGLDWRLQPRLAVGPFAAASVGRFTRVSSRVGGTDLSANLSHQASHSWIQAGLRVTYDVR